MECRKIGTAGCRGSLDCGVGILKVSGIREITTGIGITIGARIGILIFCLLLLLTACENSNSGSAGNSNSGSGGKSNSVSAENSYSGSAGNSNLGSDENPDVYSNGDSNPNSTKNSNPNSSKNSNPNSTKNSNSGPGKNSGSNSHKNSNPNARQNSKPRIVVFQSDFGVKDGAVSAMKGVAATVDPTLDLYDLTHEIPAFDIWEAAYRLQQTAAYWPAGTVFVSVIDPGVGTRRKSVVMRSKSGHYFVTPDNGTLTLVAESLGIEQVREINEELNRRKNSGQSYTFHGRDVYAFTGARLAAGIISFEEVGGRLPATVVRIPYQQARAIGDSIVGNIPILDIQYGNIWTNINDSVFKSLQVVPGKNIEVRIRHNGKLVFKQKLPFVNTFGDVPEGKTLAYMNSLMNFSLAVNMGNFSSTFKVKSGPGWTIAVRKAD